MRRITGLQIVAFFALLLIAVALAMATTWLLLRGIPLGDFRGVVLSMTLVVLLYLFALLLYRLFLYACPLQPGEICPGSGQEFVYHVYLLFFLILFYPIMRSGLVPVPLMRLFYQALGANLGPNTYSSGILFDPIFVKIGSNSIVGQGALVIPHTVEGQRLEHAPISLGDGVTIGANAVVLGGVTIESNAIVAIGAVVPRGSHIGRGEIWGGVPARRIGQVLALNHDVQ